MRGVLWPGCDCGRRLWLVLAVSLLVLLPAGHCFGETDGEAEDATAISVDEAIHRIIPSKGQDLFVVLKNGLTVLIRESRASEVVSCRVFVNTGSAFEGKDLGAGLSHYLEHLVSGGTTASFTEEEIKERLRALGGATNAYTSYDETAYYIDTTKAHYREALTLLLSYVTECRFDEGEYARERNVILQEFQMGDNDPSKQLWYLFMETAYRRHPVRYPVIGKRDRFMEIDREELMAYYARRYVPGNMVVVVAGDVEKEAALQAVIDRVGKVPRGSDPHSALPEEPGQLSFRTGEKVLPIAKLTKAIVGYRTVPLAHPDLYALDVLAVVMGDGRTSRLYRALRDEQSLALSIDASSWTPHFVEGQFLVTMTLSGQKLEEALAAVSKEVADVRENLLGETAVNRAKAKVAADHIFGSESVRHQAARLASDWVATGDPYFSEKYVAGIKAVTAEDIRRVAAKYLVRDAMTLAVVRPPSSASEAVSDDEDPRVLGTVRRQVLPNGMVLLLKQMNHVPIVSMEFMVRAGLRFEPEGKSGISRFMANLLTKGTQTRSKQTIARAIEDVGGAIGSSSGYNTVGVSVSVLKDDLDVGLDLLSDVIVHPSFPEGEIEKQRKETLLAIQRQDERWTTEVTRLFKRHYYRKHPYRNDLLGSPEAVSSLTREEIIEFYQSVIMPNNAVLAVFGDIRPDEVAERVGRAFEEFSPRVFEQPIIETETENIQEDEQFVVYNEKTSSGILVGYNGLTLTDPDRAVVDVIDAVVSGIGYPGGWLHEALRGGDKSLVYYVHAYPAFGVDGAFFAVMTQTTPANYDEVTRIVEEQMDTLQAQPVDADTLRRAKDICIIMHEMGLETISAQASSAVVNEVLDLGVDYDERYPTLIEAVTSEDVLRVAKALFSHHLLVATKPEAMRDEGAGDSGE